MNLRREALREVAQPEPLAEARWEVDPPEPLAAAPQEVDPPGAPRPDETNPKKWTRQAWRPKVV